MAEKRLLESRYKIIDMANFKPTLNDPVNDQSKNFEKDFKKTMKKNHIQLNEEEIDGLLTEKEQSLKKKIFSLAKMEALVFSDPKLTSVYDEMAANGEEKYGYHYNETIQNMIFNDYVLNSPKYLQKYKMAIPKEKKRRDKSGINQLKKTGEKKMGKMGANISDTEPKVADLKEMEKDTEPTKVAFLVHQSHPEVYAYFPEIPHSQKYMTGYAHVGQHTAIDPYYAKESRVATAEEYADLQAELEGLGYNLVVLNAMNETTSAGGGMGGPGNSRQSGTGAYVGPFAWKKGGDLLEALPIMRKPIQMITAMHENYLVDANSFEKIYNELNEEVELNEKSKSKSQQRFFGQVDAVQKGDMSAADASPAIAKAAKDMKHSDVEDFAKTKHKGLPNKVEEGENETSEYLDKKDNNIKEDTQTMANMATTDSDMTMANRADSSTVEMGMSSMNESDQLLEELENELSAFSIHHDKLKRIAEDRKTPSMVQGDRIRKENPTNFKDDLQHSGTKEIIDIEDELEWADQQTDVVDDPQKLGADIEKAEIKTADMKSHQALKNVGNSANDKGDEVPKRNLTTSEQDLVNNFRLGQEDLVYDNEPDKRFEDRMKADMGDEIYKQRENAMKLRSKQNLYNKEKQPVGEDEVESSVFNKEKTGWNKKTGFALKEMVTGKYEGVDGRTKLIDFRLNEVSEVEGIVEADFFALNFDGLGNTYDSKVDINESVQSALGGHKLYTNGKDIFAVAVPAQSLNESATIKDKPVITEQQKKMNHLLGYKPESYVNTDGTKKGRGF